MLLGLDLSHCNIEYCNFKVVYSKYYVAIVNRFRSSPHTSDVPLRACADSLVVCVCVCVCSEHSAREREGR